MPVSARRKARTSLAGLAVLALAACGTLLPPSAGDPSPGISDSVLAQSYIPLAAGNIFHHWGAAFVIAPGIAVTNAHNANLVPADSILARSRNYDLLFFRTEKNLTPRMESAAVGEQIVAYGQGNANDLREAQGTVRSTDTKVRPRCNDCVVQHAIVFSSDAGEGFSGGPLVDAKTGAVLGVVFGYLDSDGGNGERHIYAYDISLVLQELKAYLPQAAL